MSGMEMVMSDEIIVGFIIGGIVFMIIAAMLAAVYMRLKF